MAARGSIAKEEITNKILAEFPGSFKFDKEIRVPVMENNELVQIKITLTAAKVNVENGGDTATPGADLIKGMTQAAAEGQVADSTTMSIEPTPEEKENVRILLSKLNL